MGKRFFPDSIGTDSVPTADSSTATLGLPSKNTRIIKNKVVCYLTNPAADITTIPVTGEAQTELTLICTGNSGTKALKNGSTLQLAADADFTPAADDTITLMCDGTSWFEMCRSVN